MKLKNMVMAVSLALAAAARFVFEPIKRYAERNLVLYLTTESNTVKGYKPMPICKGSEVVAVREEISLAANPTAADLLIMLELPADHVPVDFILDADDMDTNGAPTLTLDVGILNDGEDDIDTGASSGGAKWMLGSTVGQAGGIVRPTTKTISRVTPTSTNRKVAVRVAVASATFAAGKIGLTLLYRAAHHGA